MSNNTTTTTATTVTTRPEWEKVYFELLGNIEANDASGKCTVKIKVIRACGSNYYVTAKEYLEGRQNGSISQDSALRTADEYERYRKDRPMTTEFIKATEEYLEKDKARKAHNAELNAKIAELKKIEEEARLAALRATPAEQRGALIAELEAQRQ